MTCGSRGGCRAPTRRGAGAARVCINVLGGLLSPSCLPPVSLLSLSCGKW